MAIMSVPDYSGPLQCPIERTASSLCRPQITSYRPGFWRTPECLHPDSRDCNDIKTKANSSPSCIFSALSTANLFCDYALQRYSRLYHPFGISFDRSLTRVDSLYSLPLDMSRRLATNKTLIGLITASDGNGLRRGLKINGDLHIPW
jgi:hypothetical protein